MPGVLFSSWEERFAKGERQLLQFLMVCLPCVSFCSLVGVFCLLFVRQLQGVVCLCFLPFLWTVASEVAMLAAFGSNSLWCGGSGGGCVVLEMTGTLSHFVSLDPSEVHWC